MAVNGISSRGEERVPLKENTLFGPIDKVQIAIERMKEFEPPEGYYLAFSGGKDSQVIYHLAEIAEVKFDAHYNNTTVDPPEVVKFIRNNYPAVEENHPKKSMWRVIESETMPPTALARYCCEDLKEYGGRGRVVITGIRWEESTKRKDRNLFETCFKDKLKHFLNPIIDWKEHEVWEYLNSRNIEHCKLYDEGYKRIGCIMCPMSGKDGMIHDAERYPKYYAAYLRAFGKMLKNGRMAKKGKEYIWQTPEEVMEWWIFRPPKGNPDQTVLFE